MLIGFGITYLIVFFIELSDSDFLDEVLIEENISSELINKIDNIILFAVGMFALITTLIYKIMTNLI